MESTTPEAHNISNARSSSYSNARGQSPPPRPTTPLRPPSRSSLRSSHTPTHGASGSHLAPLASLEPAFAELSDSMADLEANFVHLQLMHESLSRFTECFASFLYGLNVNAFCVDFPEAPVQESFRKIEDDTNSLNQHDRNPAASNSSFEQANYNEGDNSLASDNSFVGHATGSRTQFGRPATTSTRTPTRAPAAQGGRAPVNTNSTRRGPSTTTRGRPSGLARATTRGRGGTAR